MLPGPKGSTFVVGSAAKGTFVAKYGARRQARPGFRDGGFALLQGLTSETPSWRTAAAGRPSSAGGWTCPTRSGFRAQICLDPEAAAQRPPDPSYGGVRPLLVVEEGGQQVGLDFSRSVGLVQRSDGLLVMLGEAPADRYAKVPSGPNFGLVRFLAGGRLPK